ncbi:MAG: hypothetical protein E7591_06520 [Ruminococcaceae bacterium]|nr:hypothetical protein [Oscillospiraceae bacterium]
MKRLLYTFAIFISLIILLSFSSSAGEHILFSDIENNAWYEEYALYCYEHGYIKGTEYGIFSPKKGLTRAMAVQIFYKMENTQEEYPDPPFTDTDKDQWYYDALCWAYDTKLTSGTGNNLFSPARDLTRQDLVTMTFNYYSSIFHDNTARPIDIDINGYSDRSEISDYALEAFEWALSFGIINGMPNNTLCPKDKVTRAQAVKMLTEFEKNFSHKWQLTQSSEKRCNAYSFSLYRCTLCSKESRVVFDPYHLFTSEKRTLEPTCVSSGILTRYCANCTVTKDIPIPATGTHNYGMWSITNEATPYKTGTMSRKCENCSASLNRIYRHSSYYQIENTIDIPSGGYNLSTENIGLKVIRVNQKLLGSSSASYTSETRNAVARFQRRNGLAETGIVDLETWLAMGCSEYDWYNLAAYITPKRVDVFSTREDYIEAMISVAKEYAEKGTVYRIGCSGRPGSYADCSGLIYQCLYAVGINPDTNIIDHGLAIYEYTSYYLAKDPKLGLSVPLNELERGDLVFYALNGKSNVCHVGIYAGNGRIYDAWPNIGTTYRSMNIRGYHMVKAIRLFP